MCLCMPTPDGSFIHIEADVVTANIPLLLGLDVLDREQLVADNVLNQLQCHHRGWSIPISRKHGHMYVTWNISKSYYTRAELRKIHKHFWHPSSEKLFNLLKRIDPNTTADTLKVLKEIQTACSTCQKLSKAPYRFRVSIPKGDCIFNDQVTMDLVWISK